MAKKITIILIVIVLILVSGYLFFTPAASDTNDDRSGLPSFRMYKSISPTPSFWQTPTNTPTPISNNSDTPEPSESLIQPTSLPPREPTTNPDSNIFTGAQIVSVTPTLTPDTVLLFRLQDLCPYTHKSFSLDFNYGINKAEVIINDPYETSLNDFNTWLAQNGFLGIKNKYFKLMVGN